MSPSPEILKENAKHLTWKRPFFASLFDSIVIQLFTLYLSDYLAPRGSFSFGLYGQVVSILLAVYSIVVIGSRYLILGAHSLYEWVWCCNQSMMMAIIGLWTGRRILVGAAYVGVVCDQLMWYVDVVFYLSTGKPMTGVLTYLTWPHTKTIQVITAFHHLWFLPLCVYSLSWQTPARSFLLSSAYTTLSTTMARFTTPKTVWVQHKKGEWDELYANINAGYEFWRDTHIPFLHICDDQPFPIYIVFLSIVGNIVLNGLPYALLMVLESYVNS